MRHCRMRIRVVEKTVDVRHDGLGHRPDKPNRAGSNRFRTFGHITHYENGLTEGRRLLLYTPRICED